MIDYWDYYVNHLNEIVAVWNGGVAIYGAVLGGLLVMVIYSRLMGVKWVGAVDVSVLGLSLGQAVGRWGNYINQELYGLPTSVPWKIFIAPENRMVGYENVMYYHPLFLYESIGCLMLFGCLWGLYL